MRDTLVTWGRLLSQIQADIAEDGLNSEHNGTRSRSILHTVPTLAEVPQICDSALVQLAALQSERAGRSSETILRLTRALEQAAGRRWGPLVATEPPGVYLRTNL